MRRLALERAIAGEVVPRLVLAHRAALRATPVTGTRHDLEPAVERLVGLVLDDDTAAPGAFVAERQQAGEPLEALYLDLLAPAARHLGWLWEEDLCDFTRVTVALGRLQQLVHACGEAARADGDGSARESGRAGRLLLVPAPGEQHTLGITMVAELFRRSGWSVASVASGEGEDTVARVRHQWFAVVGFSLACETRLDRLAAAIQRVRRNSRNRSVGVMVGGPIFVAHPEFAAMVGADATAADANHAVGQAQALLAFRDQKK